MQSQKSPKSFFFFSKCNFKRTRQKCNHGNLPQSFPLLPRRRARQTKLVASNRKDGAIDWWERRGGGRRGDGWGRQIRTEAEHRGEVRGRNERVEETRGRERGKKCEASRREDGSWEGFGLFVMRAAAEIAAQQIIMQHTAAFRKLNTGSKRC